MSTLLRRVLWLGAVFTGGSGLAHAWMKYLLPAPDEWSVVNHPLQPWLLKVHIVAAPVLVFALGVAVGGHAWRLLRSRSLRGRRTGVMVVAVLAPMALSGALIQTMTEATWLAMVAWVHGITGGVFLCAIFAHRWAALRFRRREEERVDGPGRDARRPLLAR